MHTPLDWKSPQVQLAIQEAQETLQVRARDSRLVRAAFLYSSWKKKIRQEMAQQVRRFTQKQASTNSLRVFFWLPGGMGDALCARRMITAYRELLPQALFEIYCPLAGVAELICQGDPFSTPARSEKIYYPNYDLVVQACLAAKFLFANELRLKQQAPDFWPVYNQARQAQQTLGILLEDMFLTEPVLGRLAYRLEANRFDLLCYTAGTHVAPPNLPVMPGDHFGLKDKKYITFHDGTSTAQTHHPSPTRAWPGEKWQQFITAFKQEHPDILVVQLGAKNSPVYAQADICLVNKTSVSDLPGLLSQALAHVDTESGLVHMASGLPVRSVVLYGPTDKAFYAYEKNKNLSAGTCHSCMWLKSDWMFRCPLNRPAAEQCMAQISVEQVLEAVNSLLHS